MHVVLRKALSQALSDGLIPRNAADGVKLPRAGVSGDEIKPLNSDECGAFLEASRGERLEAGLDPGWRLSAAFGASGRVCELQNRT